MNRIARATVTAFRPRLAQQVARVPTKFAFVRQPVQFAVRSFGADGGMELEGEVRRRKGGVLCRAVLYFGVDRYIM
jgi:hypothetical protein